MGITHILILTAALALGAMPALGAATKNHTFSVDVMANNTLACKAFQRSKPVQSAYQSGVAAALAGFDVPATLPVKLQCSDACHRPSCADTRHRIRVSIKAGISSQELSLILASGQELAVQALITSVTDALPGGAANPWAPLPITYKHGTPSVCLVKPPNTGFLAQYACAGTWHPKKQL